MPGMGDEIEGAIQQAAQLARQFIVVNSIVAKPPLARAVILSA
jgi:hypothetical protein